MLISVLVCILFIASCSVETSAVALSQEDKPKFPTKIKGMMIENKLKEERIQNRRKRDVAENSEPLISESTEDFTNEVNTTNSGRAFVNKDITQLLLTHNRERRKQERLKSIKTHVLRELQIDENSEYDNEDSSIFSEKEQQQIENMIHKVNAINRNNNDGRRIEDDFQTSRRDFEVNPSRSSTVGQVSRHSHAYPGMQWFQSFYPSCTLQEHTDPKIWEHSGTFRLYFNLNRYARRTDITVLLAKLRLYKVETDLSELQKFDSFDAADNNSNIHVSLYQILRPLRINKRERKRLVDSKTIAFSKRGWIEFDVAEMISYMLRNSHRNYGFHVQVEDDDGNKLNPNLFFHNFNCSSLDTEIIRPPFPNLRSIYPELINASDFALFDSEPYPTLDLHIADVTSTSNMEKTRHASRHFKSSRITSISRESERQDRVLKKRHLDHCKRLNHCQKTTSYIALEDLGLENFVISPKGIDLISCLKHVSLSAENVNVVTTASDLSTATNYSAENIEKYREDITCIPSQWESLPIIYINSGEIRYTVLSNFVPTDCACRTS